MIGQNVAQSLLNPETGERMVVCLRCEPNTVVLRGYHSDAEQEVAVTTHLEQVHGEDTSTVVPVNWQVN